MKWSALISVLLVALAADNALACYGGYGGKGYKGKGYKDDDGYYYKDDGYYYDKKGPD